MQLAGLRGEPAGPLNPRCWQMDDELTAADDRFSKQFVVMNRVGGWWLVVGVAGSDQRVIFHIASDESGSQTWRRLSEASTYRSSGVRLAKLI
ncbi:hypothetical protein LSTR_LSTR005653 [Laodelphax striatellus]|uniref:Uncharacterized protein n=1 Tax=Laodelphax striatellus TaxID=195883 RepID=A0A482WVZ6_LAOST|nr:hypothetical protein LSTR_LSTR005653 [Laodelphax striatellus]